jgi:hypothetical protein
MQESQIWDCALSGQSEVSWNSEIGVMAERPARRVPSSAVPQRNHDAPTIHNLN